MFRNYPYTQFRQLFYSTVLKHNIIYNFYQTTPMKFSQNF